MAETEERCSVCLSQRPRYKCPGCGERVGKRETERRKFYKKLRLAPCPAFDNINSTITAQVYNAYNDYFCSGYNSLGIHYMDL